MKEAIRCVEIARRWGGMRLLHVPSQLERDCTPMSMQASRGGDLSSARGYVVILLFSLSLFCSRAGGEEFEVEGVVKITPLRYSIPPYSFRMTIHHRGCHWAISRTPVADAAGRVRMLVEDGEAIYQITQPNQTADPVKAAQMMTTIGKVVQIHRSGFPIRVLAPETIMLFYAYNSGCYLDSLKNGGLHPIKFSPHELDFGDRRVVAMMQRRDDSSRLPTNITFLGSEGVHTNAVLTSLSFTNTGNVHVPLRVQLTRFGIQSEEPIELYEFVVQEVRPRCSLATFTPDATGASFATDFRFAEGAAYVPPVVHGVVSNSWPSADDAKTKPGYKAARADWEKIATPSRRPVEDTNSQTKRLLVMSVLVFSFVGVGAFLLTTFVQARSGKRRSEISQTTTKRGE